MVVGHFWMFLKVGLLPFVLSLFLGIVLVAFSFALAEAAALLSIPLQILGIVPLAILGIACCRLVLIGRQAGAVPRPLFGRRTLVYFGYTLMFLLMIALPLIIFSFAVIGAGVFSIGNDLEDPNLRDFAWPGLILVLIFPFYLVLMYLVTRFSLVFPAVSVDQKLGLGGSWRLTRGNGLKLYAVLIVITILTIVCSAIAMTIINTIVTLLWHGLDSVPASAGETDWITVAAAIAPTMILGLAFEYLGFALIIAAVAAAYAHLSGWGAPRQDILERFE